jgi:SAM-dependent methyltransferase
MTVETYDKRGRGSYRGYHIIAVSQLHKRAIQVVNGLDLEAGTPCLDLGAGTGAFSVRLKDCGMSVEAGDFVPINLENEGIKTYQLDLNKSFSKLFSGRRFQLITCLEVLEHLENPFHLFRECNELLPLGGYLIFSTPNVESWMARLLFLFNGKLPWFGEKSYFEEGHLIPYFSWQIPIIARLTGFEFTGISHTENRFLIYAGPKGLFPYTIKYLLSWIIRPVLKGCKDGEIHVILLKKIKNLKEG